MSETLSAVQPTATPASTMAGVLQAMGQQQQSVPEDQRGLADRLKELQEQLENDPSLESDPKFATQVAWLMQDWPKFSGTGQAVQVSPLLHAGLNAMAGQYPGISNPQVISMLQQTTAMDDRQLVADIRNASMELGALPAEQQTSFLISAGVNALAARAAQAGVAPAPQPSPVVRSAPAHEPTTLASVTEQPPRADERAAGEKDHDGVISWKELPPDEQANAPGVLSWRDISSTVPDISSADHRAPTETVTPPVAASIAAESVAQATSLEATAGTEMEAGGQAPVQSMDNAEHGNASAEHAMQNIPVGDHDGASAPRAGETVDATRGEPEAQATQSTQEPSQTGSEQTVPPGMTEAQEDDARRRDAELNQGAQNTPPEQQNQNPPKQPEQGSTQSQTRTKEIEGQQLETKGASAEQAQAATQAQTQTAQPAQAPVGSLAGHIVSKGVNVAKSWFANQAVASDQRRIDSLVATVDGNIRMADRHYQDLKQSAAPFFKKLEETAQQEGVKPAALMASMGEGGKHYGLWQEFTNLRMTDERVGKPYNDLATTLQDMRRNLGSLQSEAAERGATNAQSVTGVEERAGQKAMEMEGVPGRNPGESLIKSIGGALERIMEKVKARFLALTQGREQGRDTSPSMGA
jgi:hypothetical protein